MSRYSLTGPQKNIYTMKRTHPDHSIENIGGTIILDGYPTDYALWKKILNNFVERHEILRTTIYDHGAEPYQIVRPYKPIDIKRRRMGAFSHEASNRYFSKVLREKIPSGQEVRFEILDFGNQKTGLFVALSHYICDAYSIAIMAKEVINDYMNTFDAKLVIDKEVHPYFTLLEREKSYKESSRFLRDKEYWTKVYAQLPCSETLAVRSCPSPSATRYAYLIKKDMAKRIKGFCQQHRIYEAVFFEAILFTYLSIVLGEEHLAIGSPVLNRKGRKEKETIGMFINTLPLVFTVNRHESFLDVCKGLSSAKLQMFKHQQLPLDMIHDIASQHVENRLLFSTVFSFQNAKITGERANDKISTDWMLQPGILYDLIMNVDDRDNKGEYKILCDFKKGCFNEHDIESIVCRYIYIIEQVINDPYACIEKVSVLTTRDTESLNTLNNRKDYVDVSSITSIFHEQVKKHQRKEALIHDGTSLTYVQLNMKANQLASILMEMKLGKGSIVPIIGGRSSWVIIAMLAVMKAGYCFFVIDDKEYPIKRIDQLIANVKAQVILTYGTDYTNPYVSAICVDQKVPSSQWIEEVSVQVKASETMYLIHTSGSTGEPKLVEVPREGVVNMVTTQGYLLDGIDTFVSFVTMSFDAFIMDVFLTLMNGKTLVLATNDEVKSIRLTEELLSNYKDFALTLTPSRVSQYLKNSSNRHWEETGTLLLGGEQVTPSLISLIKSKMNNPSIFNLYGPSETTVFCTGKNIQSVDDLSVGKPISNVECYIVNKNQQLLPPGARGEILVRGPGVANGYLNDDTLTKKKFSIDTKTGLRQYLTGDYGYINHNDEIMLLGRVDQQIKYNGLRIELAEIEHRMNQFEGIDISAVKLDSYNTQQVIIGYYESKREIDQDLLRFFMNQYLPMYMVPSFFVKLNKIPKTASDKIDYAAIIGIDDKTFEHDDFCPPSTELESVIQAVWQSKLGIPAISVTDSFYAIGGTSKQLIDITLQIEQRLDVKLNLSHFSLNPTVREIAEYIDRGCKKASTNATNYDLTAIIKRQSNQYTDILLTGASGFLGSHLLFKLLKTTTSQVYCLVRDEDKMKDRLRFYFKEDLDEHLHRVSWIRGDISKEYLGMSFVEYQKLLKTVGVVYNAAANVGHFETFEMAKGANLDGVYELIKFSGLCGASLHHISTLTVSGIGVASQTKSYINFDEHQLNIGQDYENDAYLHTKYLAEELVTKAFDLGLDTKIYRTGAIGPRSYDGVFQYNASSNGLLMVKKMVEELKKVPEALIGMTMYMCPVDVLANDIIKLSRCNSSMHRFHLYDDHQVFEIGMLDTKASLEVLPNKAFLDYLDHHLQLSVNHEYTIAYHYLKNLISNPTTNVISRADTAKLLEEIMVNE